MGKIKIVALLIAVFTIHELFFVDSFTTYYLLKTEREDGIQLYGVSTYQFIGNQVYQKGEGYQQFYDNCSVEDKSNWVCENGGFGVLNGEYFNNWRSKDYTTVSKFRYAWEQGRWARIDKEGMQYIWPLLVSLCLIVPGRYQ